MYFSQYIEYSDTDTKVASVISWSVWWGSDSCDGALLRLIRLCGRESLSRRTHSNNTLELSYMELVCRDLGMGAGVYSNKALIYGHGAKTGSGV